MGKNCKLKNFFFLALTLTILIIPLPVIAKDREIKYELFDNYRIYTYTEFTTGRKLPPIILVEVYDDRKLEEKEQISDSAIIERTEETDWARPLATMLQNLIEKELHLAGLARVVVARRDNADYILQIHIQSFEGVVKKKTPKVVGGRYRISPLFVTLEALGRVKFTADVLNKRGEKKTSLSYDLSASRDLSRFVNKKFWAIKIAASALSQAVEEMIKELDTKL